MTTDKDLHVRANRYLTTDSWGLPLRTKVLLVASMALFRDADDRKRAEVLDLLAEVGRVELATSEEVE